MSRDIALERYLQRHIEPGLPAAPKSCNWQYTLVIPAYRESVALLQVLADLPHGAGSALVILVLNRPDTDADALVNQPLRDAVAQLPLRDHSRPENPLHRLNTHTDLYLFDLEVISGPTPGDQGVGLARKTGCDLALKWMHEDAIAGQWICCTDADATLSRDYFQQLDNVSDDSIAAVFPFRHIPGDAHDYNAATALYELRLHHYVLGLESAHSPYAFHTLGSALAFRATAYSQVRGFPKRSGAEDFYLLNKLAKLGRVARVRGECIRLQSRHSDRVPFGTGPAVSAIAAVEQPYETPLFYAPACFEMLGAALAAIPALAVTPSLELMHLLEEQGLSKDRAQQALSVLDAMGWDNALEHCRRHGKTEAQFLRQFHQWFDGFRTLKFIHALRDAHWPLLSLKELEALPNSLWPATGKPTKDVDERLDALNRYWNWQYTSDKPN